MSTSCVNFVHGWNFCQQAKGKMKVIYEIHCQMVHSLCDLDAGQTMFLFFQAEKEVMHWNKSVFHNFYQQGHDSDAHKNEKDWIADKSREKLKTQIL